MFAILGFIACIAVSLYVIFMGYVFTMMTRAFGGSYLFPLMIFFIGLFAFGTTIYFSPFAVEYRG